MRDPAFPDWMRPLAAPNPDAPLRRGEPRAEWTSDQWGAYESAMAEVCDMLLGQRTVGDARRTLRRLVGTWRRARGLKD